jgi:NAD(P)-dependent dehydrogenase (short-subunit alcohol dehydrogenase family)
MQFNTQNMNNIFDLSNKVALVTGGAGILGKYFCAALAYHGAKVIIADINYDDAKEAKKLLNEETKLDNFYAIELDITDENSVKKSIEFIEQKFQRLDILHNNAASKSSNLKNYFDDLRDYKMSIWEEVMKVNIDGMFLMARDVSSYMIEKKIKGSIIQTSSIYGIMGPDQRIYEGSEYMGIPINTAPVYSASKSAVVGLTKYLATYLGEYGIRVNTITPGGVESGQNDVFKRKYSNRVPLNRMAKAHEMVGALIYLSSNASSYVTGQNIIVDGGLSAW